MAISCGDVRRFLNERRFTLLFSGGKDSTATLLWVLENIGHDDWNILYVEVTGNTHPLCNQYVHRVCKELGVHGKLLHVKRRDLDFFDCLAKYGVPVIGKYRWCLNRFKQPFFMDGRLSHITQVSGIRRSDSSRRSKSGMVVFFRMTKKVVVNPLLAWSKKDVLRYLKQHGVELNPCYELYGHSGNCMFCPYHSRRSIVLTLNDPVWREKILSSLKCGKDKTSREKYEKWMFLSRQTVLINRKL